MQHIEYNMKFRRSVSKDMLKLFLQYGITTGSSLIEGITPHDVDIAILCNVDFIASFNYCVTDDNAVNAFVVSSNESIEDTDSSQYIFNVLLQSEYALYRKSNYRDSTFLSCYVHYGNDMFNLLLMDEVNVFQEWRYATKCLWSERANPVMQTKYKRIKFFEKCRKDFRKKLT